MQRAWPGPLELPPRSIGVYSLNNKNRSVKFRHAACGQRGGCCDRGKATSVVEAAVDRNHRLGLRVGGSFARLATFRPEELTMLNRLMWCGVALVLLTVATPVAAQDSSCGSSCSDRDLLNLPHSGGLSNEDRNRLDDLKAEEGKHDAAVVAEGDLRQKLLRLPPLPDERNGLLGSWRQENGGQLGMLGLEARNGDDMVRELWETLQSNPDKLMPSRCVVNFGNGVTFAPSTYSSRALDGSRPGGSIAYRSGEQQVVWVIPDNLKPMPFKIVGPDRILLGLDGSCALVRVGAQPTAAPAIKAAANATTGPGNARTAAKAASANCVVAGVQLGVDTVANVERDIQARGGSPLTGGSGVLGKFRMTAMSGDYQDAGFDPMAVNYDFDASGPDGRLVAVTIANRASAVPDYETLLASRKAAAAAIAGPLQQKSATELVASGPGCQLRLLPNADTLFIREVYQLPN